MTATLNYDLRNGLESGTDEMGAANLKMIMDFAVETFFDTLLLASKAKAKGLINSNLISVRDLCHVVFDDLKKQDKEFAGIWNSSWFEIIKNGEMLCHWLENWKGIIFVDSQSIDEGESIADLLLYLDYNALKMEAMLEDMKSA